MNLDFSNLKRKEINYSGIMSFFRSQEPMKVIACDIKLRDNVDSNVLQQAVDRTLERMPYMGDTFVEENGLFYYAENPLPMVVRETDVYPHVGGSETNYHMLDVICHDNVISISMFHSFCDGVGFGKFIETVLYYYFCVKDGVDYEPNGTVTHHTVMTEAETFEPYGATYSYDPAALSEVPRPGESFVLPEITGTGGDFYKSMKAVIPEKNFVDYAKSLGSSPSVVLAMMIGEAIEIVHPDHEKPIVGFLPASTRLGLGCPETFKNTIGYMALTLNSPELDKLSFGERAANIRKIQKLQMQPDVVRAQTNYTIDACHKIEKIPGGYWDKLKAMMGFRASNTSMGSFMFDYVNILNSHTYYENIVDLEVVAEPVGLSVTAYGLDGMIHLYFLFKDDMSCYGRAMNEVFKKHGFDSKFSEPVERQSPPSTGWREILNDN
ncbi:MAG: hypothetical protein IJ619_00820 [Eubacterium sp.]|nr:hypothetical protein [Eubacterium sp.]